MDAIIKKPSSASLPSAPGGALPADIRAVPSPAVPRPSRAEAEAAVRTLIAYAGDDPAREGLLDTPKRVVSAYEELYGGYRESPVEVLDRTFSEIGSYDDLVLVRDIPFHSHCEHHMMPFVGKAQVGYVPDGRVVGLSEVVRVVEGYARRPQIQERLTAQIADSLHGALGSRGSIVVIEAEHTCMTMRGAEKPGTITVTRAARGVYAEDAALRAEFLAHVSDR